MQRYELCRIYIKLCHITEMLMASLVRRRVVCSCTNLVLYARAICIDCYGQCLRTLTYLIMLVLGIIFCCLDPDLDLRYPPWRSNIWLDCFTPPCQVRELLQYILKVRP